MREHLIIPDAQVTPDTPQDHLDWIGQYIVDQKPDVIVNIGDFWDFESLSSYDYGKKAAEGRRVDADAKAGCAAMDRLLKPLNEYNQKKSAWKEKQYKPEMHFTEGNHEERVKRAAQMDAKIDGLLPDVQLMVEHFGWTFHPFLKPVEVDGVHYVHYVQNPRTGRPLGGESCDTRLKNVGYSFTMGHQQGLKSAIRELTNGRLIRGLICGSSYLHDEDYCGFQGNSYWRGIIYKHEVFDGCYDLMEVSLDYLCRRYEGMPVSDYMKKKYPDIFHHSVWLQRLDARRQQMRAAA